MNAGFESQWDAAWFRDRAEQCFRLAATLTPGRDATALHALGQEFEAEAKVAQDLQSRARLPAEPMSNEVR